MPSWHVLPAMSLIRGRLPPARPALVATATKRITILRPYVANVTHLLFMGNDEGGKEHGPDQWA
jgi:hypothetical protein